MHGSRGNATNAVPQMFHFIHIKSNYHACNMNMILIWGLFCCSTLHSQLRRKSLQFVCGVCGFSRVCVFLLPYLELFEHLLLLLLSVCCGWFCDGLTHFSYQQIDSSVLACFFRSLLFQTNTCQRRCPALAEEYDFPLEKYDFLVYGVRARIRCAFLFERVRNFGGCM